MQQLPIAHVSEDGHIHSLEDHLNGTAERASAFAAGFGAAGWGRLAGLWHDLGKFSPQFQCYIRATGGIDAHLETVPGRVDHSTPGAAWAVDRHGMAGRVIAYTIAGHHAGLPDWIADETGATALSVRLRNPEHLKRIASSGIPPELLSQPLPLEKPNGFDPAFWIRMLFSCVVDADFLDTEEFFDPGKARLRGRYPALVGLLPQFEQSMAEKIASSKPTRVNLIRADVLRQCIAAATKLPGAFSLAVPTGGGKTLSSMAFALHHAAQHGKERIIYVIPYTSIIEQTAEVFRGIFGETVLEHHSNLDVSDVAKDSARSRLACENWDAPIVVTTSVQFFESLFASRTSRSRKLHNIVNSVVVLDEAQLLPPEYLNPILHILDELRKNYGVTLLVSTATQPALGPQPSFGFKGLTDISEIIPDPHKLHTDLKRVSLEIPADLNTPVSWERLAEEIVRHDSVLCIVNLRNDARDLWKLLPEETVHLSRLMCGEHLSRKIAEIKERLLAGQPVRVVSTQLVEAGVDLDFPVVYRALAGLDSLAQAAGRCNREGRLSIGVVKTFVPPTQPPPGILRQAASISRQLLGPDVVDYLSPDRFEDFFRQLYWMQGPRLDSRQILDDLVPAGEREFRYSFRTAAGKFRIIDDSAYASVTVPYGEGAELIRKLEYKSPERDLLRSLQRYIVNLPRYIHGKLVGEGVIQEIHPGIFILTHPAYYDDNLGFLYDRSIIYDPDDLVC